MNPRFSHKKVGRGRPTRYSQPNNSDSKNNFRGQDNYQMEKRRYLSDSTLYNIARFLMGNEIVVFTKAEKVEGVLKGFDSSAVWLSKVFVFDHGQNKGFFFVKDILEGKEVLIRDILMIKVISTNGKTDNMLVDQEISQKKQVNKVVQPDDKNLVPYFENFEGHLNEEEKEDDDMNISMKGDQGCWYNPEDMIKDNEERFNLKSTFNDNMEEYTTQIDRTDPLLQEKYERAEKLAREMENESSLRRVKPYEEDDGREHDEEIMFSAVVTSVPPTNNSSEVLTASTAIKLNPNAPEFRPRSKTENYDHQHIQQLDEISIPNLQIISVESVPQPQMIPLESVQHQQHQQMIQRLALQLSMTPQTMPTQQCSGQRFVSATPTQWTVPIHNNSPGQYMIQQYLQHGPIQIPSVFQARPMAPDGTQNQAPGVFYSLGPLQGSLQGQFFVQPDHSSGALSDGSQHHPHHMYVPSLDVLPSQIQQQQLRQPHLVPTNNPVLQAAASANQLQQHQAHAQAHHTYFTQSPHNLPLIAGGQPMNAGTHAPFSQLIFNTQAQQSGTPTIQGFLPPSNNGRP